MQGFSKGHSLGGHYAGTRGSGVYGRINNERMHLPMEIAKNWLHFPVSTPTTLTFSDWIRELSSLAVTGTGGASGSPKPLPPWTLNSGQKSLQTTAWGAECRRAVWKDLQGWFRIHYPFRKYLLNAHCGSARQWNLGYMEIAKQNLGH